MSNLKGWYIAPPRRHDVVAIPIVWLTLLLSLLFHAAMLWFWLPQLPMPHLSLDDNEPGKARPVLVTRLAPVTVPAPESPPPAPPPRAAAPPMPRVRPPVAMVRPPPPSPPPVVAASTRTAEPLPPPPAPAVVAPPAPRPPPEADLASYIEAKRRARGDPTTSAGQGTTTGAAASETEAERRDRIIAANLAPSQQPTFGYDPKSGGGVFQLKRIGYTDAEFYFTGWNRDIGRRAKQLIEVRKASDEDIHQAIIRKMIEMIRGEVQGDFNWLSDRVGRQVVMSARPKDGPALEEFLMEEFFPDPRRRR